MLYYLQMSQKNMKNMKKIYIKKIIQIKNY